MPYAQPTMRDVARCVDALPSSAFVHRESPGMSTQMPPTHTQVQSTHAHGTQVTPVQSAATMQTSVTTASTAATVSRARANTNGTYDWPATRNAPGDTLHAPAAAPSRALTPPALLLQSPASSAVPAVARHDAITAALEAAARRGDVSAVVDASARNKDNARDDVGGKWWRHANTDGVTMLAVVKVTMTLRQRRCIRYRHLQQRDRRCVGVL
jgi:hypothetical protein